MNMNLLRMTIKELEEYANELDKLYKTPYSLFKLKLEYFLHYGDVYTRDMTRSLSRLRKCLIHGNMPQISYSRTNLKTLAYKYGYSYSYIKKVSCLCRWKEQRFVFQLIIRRKTVEKMRKGLVMN